MASPSLLRVFCQSCSLTAVGMKPVEVEVVKAAMLSNTVAAAATTRPPDPLAGKLEKKGAMVWSYRWVELQGGSLVYHSGDHISSPLSSSLCLADATVVLRTPSDGGTGRSLVGGSNKALQLQVRVAGSSKGQLSATEVLLRFSTSAELNRWREALGAHIRYATAGN